MSFFRSIYSYNLPRRAMLVYFNLNDRSDKDNCCFPSFSRIARDVGLSRSTVMGAVDSLKRAGILTTEQRYKSNGGYSSLMYTLKK